MRTELMRQNEADQIWLERLAEENSGPEKSPEKIPLDSWPFSIGRNPNCDFCTPSGRVSREHAILDRVGDVIRLRDLGSTNGTFVNGERVEEVDLADGDVIIIADYEIHFRRVGTRIKPSAATMVMDDDSSQTASGMDEGDFVRSLRALHETLALGAVMMKARPIVHLNSGRVEGYEIVPRQGWVPLDDRPSASDGAVAAWPSGPLAATEGRLSARARAVQRWLAAELAESAPSGLAWFFGLAAWEIDERSLGDSLRRLALIADGRRCVVQIDAASACDIPFFRDFVERLKDDGIQVAYTNFARGARQIEERKKISPDYYVLAPSLAQSLVGRGKENKDQLAEKGGVAAGGPVGQAEVSPARLKEVVSAAQGYGAEVIATGVDSKQTLEACRRGGCRLAMGEIYGGFRPIERGGAFEFPNSISLT